jgi:hypothetical protein
MFPSLARLNDRTDKMKGKGVFNGLGLSPYSRKTKTMTSNPINDTIRKRLTVGHTPLSIIEIFGFLNSSGICCASFLIRKKSI